MSFHHPALLWLLALPVLWGFWQWVRRGHLVVLPFDHGRQREGGHSHRETLACVSVRQRTESCLWRWRLTQTRNDEGRNVFATWGPARVHARKHRATRL